MIDLVAIKEILQLVDRLAKLGTDLRTSLIKNANLDTEEQRNADAAARIAAIVDRLPNVCPTCGHARPVIELDQASDGTSGVRAGGSGSTELDADRHRNDQPAGPGAG